MAFNLRQTVIDFLQNHPEQKFTAKEIALWISQTYPSDCLEKKEKSRSIKTDAELVQQLAAEIGSRRPNFQENHPELKTTEGRPRKYYYSQKSDSDEVAAAEEGASNRAAKTTESTLYPILCEYLWKDLRVYSKRINEKRSSNTKGSRGNWWLHPDVVGLVALGNQWRREIQDCVKECGDERVKLWSLEVKVLINRSNVRECFFQSVSNSSWANLGYLVAAEIEGKETLEELRILAGAHGIGLIKLDCENPSESQVLIPARERVEIDWDTANRLATENGDFQAFVKLVTQFHQTGEAKLSDWDIPKETD